MRDGAERQPRFNWTTLLWVLLAWFILAPAFRALSPTSPSGEISYTEFKQQVSGGNVAEVTLKGNHISGKFRAAEKGSITDSRGQPAGEQDADNGEGRSIFSFFRSDDGGSQPQYFRTTKPDVRDERLLPLLEQNDVIVRAESEEQPWIWTLILSLLPWVLIFGLFYYASRKMQERMGAGGAADDLKKATQLARRMVCQWGMSEKLGPVTFSSGEAHPFLGRELTEEKDFSDRTAHLIDAEILKIVGGMEQRAIEMLSSSREQLDALAEELLEKEILSRDDIDRVLKRVNAN